MDSLFLAIKLLLREWRAGELRLLAIALMIAVAVMTSIGFYSDRIQQAMLLQATEMLAADVAIDSPFPIPTLWKTQALNSGLHVAEKIQFVSMIGFKDQLQLSNIKAVSNGYPLRGQLKILKDKKEQLTEHIPQSGEIWVEPRLMDVLKLQAGDTVTIGEAVLKIAAIVAYMPDRDGSVFNMAPNILMNSADLSATGLEQPGSRLTYSLLLSGTKDALAKYHAWLKPMLKASQSWLSIDNARLDLRRILDNATYYFHLIALISVLLASLTVAVSAKRHSDRHYDVCAILRCLGASGKQIIVIYGSSLLLLGFIASLLGGLLGFILQFVFDIMINRLTGVTLPLPGIFQVTIGLATGLLILCGFGIAPIINLKDIPTMRVLRQDLEPIQMSGVLGYLFPGLVLLLLLWWAVQTVSLTLTIALGLIVLCILTWMLVKGSLYCLGYFQPPLIALIKKQRIVWQIILFTFLFLLLFIVMFLRTALLSSWKEQFPSKTPNYFLINIQEDNLHAVQDFFRNNHLNMEKFYPIVRGRLSQLNGQNILQALDENTAKTRALHRQLNISWTKKLPEDNSIVKGQWWQTIDHGKAFVSLEQGLANRLGLQLGDELGFEFENELITAKIVNLRKVAWGSFHANFYVLFPPGVLNDFSKNYITSFYVPPENKSMIIKLIKTYPTLTLIDIEKIIKQIQTIIKHASYAIEYLFVFIFLSAIILFLAMLQSGMDERLYENILFRIIGADNYIIRRRLLTEFFCIGVVSSVLALFLAMLISIVISVYYLNIVIQITLPSLLMTLAFCIGLVVLCGLFATRRLLSHTPVQLLHIAKA